MITLSFPSIVTFILMACTFPITGYTLTLEEFLTAVKSTHPAIKEAQLDAKSAKYQSRMDGWLPDPKVGLEFEEVPLKNPGLKQADKTNYKFSQEVPFPGKLISKGQAAKNEYEAKKSMATEEERRILFEAKKAYFQLYSTRQQITDQNNLVNAYQTLSKNFENRYASRDQGMSKNNMDDLGKNNFQSGFSDLTMTKMKQAESEAALFDLQHQEHALIAKINLMRGVMSMEKIGTLDTPKLKKLALSEEAMESKLENQNATLKSFQWMIEKSHKDLATARQGLVPDFETEFMYQQRSDADNAYTLGLNLTIPLWFNTHAAEISQAKTNVKKAEAAKERQDLDLKTELHYLVHHASEHQKIVTKYRNEIVPLAKAAFDSATSAFSANLTDVTEVTQRKVAYHQAQNMYWQMWEDYQTEYALLEMLVGEEL